MQIYSFAKIPDNNLLKNDSPDRKIKGIFKNEPYG